jgi:hypothetical protein
MTPPKCQQKFIHINIYNINAQWLKRDTRKSKAIKELTAAK